MKQTEYKHTQLKNHELNQMTLINQLNQHTSLRVSGKTSNFSFSLP